tara:strand:- start:232 stop:360 length:129 start_codon:yes stop_codon:yes gene_type:complete
MNSEPKKRFHINQKEVARIAKQYKKIKKYQKSNLFQIKKLNE